MQFPDWARPREKTLEPTRETFAVLIPLSLSRQAGPEHFRIRRAFRLSTSLVVVSFLYSFKPTSRFSTSLPLPNRSFDAPPPYCLAGPHCPCPVPSASSPFSRLPHCSVSSPSHL